MSLADPSPEPAYDDRLDAGARLAEALRAYRGRDVVVLAIPRGGLPVAAEVADALGAELDVIVARKLGAPGHEELAIGAVTPDGARWIDPDVRAFVGASDDYVERETVAELREARRRELFLRGHRPRPALRGRTVIVVDDGLATGATMHAAVESVRAGGAERVVVAVPVGARAGCDALASIADEIVCPVRPEPFQWVGLHYRHFEQVDDAHARAILRGHAPRSPRRG